MMLGRFAWMFLMPPEPAAARDNGEQEQHG
jgi:hypothetical protein